MSRLVMTCQSIDVMTSVSVRDSTEARVTANQTTTSHGPTRPNSASSRRRRMNATGTTTRVNKVDVTRPPITTVANGGHSSFSRPETTASGHSAAMVVAEVINTGRVRSRTDANAAAPAEPPARMRCCMRSTSRIAGFTDKPISTPTPAMTITTGGRVGDDQEPGCPEYRERPCQHHQHRQGQRLEGHGEHEQHQQQHRDQQLAHQGLVFFVLLDLDGVAGRPRHGVHHGRDFRIEGARGRPRRGALRVRRK